MGSNAPAEGTVAENETGKPKATNGSASLMDEMCFPAMLSDGPALRGAKVTIVGCGSVGMACANAILFAGLTSTMIFADVDQRKVKGEVMDFVHGGAFHHANVKAAESNYDGSEDSDIIIITAGARQRPGESRLDLVSRNARIFASIIPPLVARSPAALLLVVSNPVDILTAMAARLAGLPRGRVFGSGTYLDSSRLRVDLSAQLGVSPQSIHANILGEHGDSSVAVASVANLAGGRFADAALTPDLWGRLHRRVVGAAAEVIALKGYTNWGVGAAVGALVGFILRDEKRVVPVSVAAAGAYGIEEDVFLSLPAVLGRGGVERVVRVPLSQTEQEQLRESAHSLAKVASSVAL